MVTYKGFLGLRATSITFRVKYELHLPYYSLEEVQAGKNAVKSTSLSTKLKRRVSAAIDIVGCFVLL